MSNYSLKNIGKFILLKPKSVRLKKTRLEYEQVIPMRMDKKHIRFFYLFILFPFISLGQAGWTLDDCLEYALSHNTALRAVQLDFLQSEITENQIKKSFVPSLNATVTHGYNWGQSIDPFTNEFASDRVRNNNFYLSSDWTLFNGLQNQYYLKSAKTGIIENRLNEEIQKRNIKIDVTSQYLKIILDYSDLEIAKNQFKYTLENLERIKNLIEEKQVAEYSLLEIESQLALDSLKIVESANSVRISTLTLKQYLGIKSEDDFIISVEKNMPNTDSLVINDLSFVLDSMPDMKKIKLSIVENSLNHKIAKSKRYPSLVFSGAIGSGYSGNNKEVIGSELFAKPFDQQLRENFYQYAALSLRIPIFNSGVVASEIAKTKIELEKSKLLSEQRELELRNKIEQLLIEIENTIMQVNASEIALNAASKELEVADAKYKEGIITFVEFLRTREKQAFTQSRFTDAQFSYFFKHKVLEYYTENF